MFGPHDRFFSQMIQTLLYMMFAALLDCTISHSPSFALGMALILGMYTPFKIKSITWPQAGVASVWYPLMIKCLLCFRFDDFVDESQALFLVIVGLQWWLRGLLAAAESGLDYNARPAPWPDPAPIISFGYSGRYSVMSYPRHHRKFGRVTTLRCEMFDNNIPFAKLLFQCVVFLNINMLVGLYDLSAHLFSHFSQVQELDWANDLNYELAYQSAYADSTHSTDAEPSRVVGGSAKDVDARQGVYKSYTYRPSAVSVSTSPRRSLRQLLKFVGCISLLVHLTTRDTATANPVGYADWLASFACLGVITASLRFKFYQDQAITKLEEPSYWEFLNPFSITIEPYLKPWLDWRSLLEYRVQAPRYQDDVNVQCVLNSHNGVRWRLRRHIRRVEAKILERKQKHSSDTSHKPRPPPEPPPPSSEDITTHICALFESAEELLKVSNLSASILTQVTDILSEIGVAQDIRWNTLVCEFLSTHDPSKIVDMMFLSPTSFTQGVRQVSWPIGEARHFEYLRVVFSGIDRVPWCTYFVQMCASARSAVTRPISSLQTLFMTLKSVHPIETARCLVHCINSPRAYNAATTKTIPLIVDSGASVCISPCRDDFISFKQSTVKIRDLSKSNTVQGQGMIRWRVHDKNGVVTSIDVPGFYIPQAEVRLLSPQVLLQLVGGESRQTIANLCLCLDSGIELVANYCPRSNLPVLSVTDNVQDRNVWHSAFHVAHGDIHAFVSQDNVLSQENTNLSASQKEVLLWHHRLSHASVSWLQLLMRDRKWMTTNVKAYSLHQGPFIPCREIRSPVCDIRTLKCASCLTAKACTRSSNVRHQSHDVRQPNVDMNKFAQRLEGRDKCVLKRGHVQRGDCISADHYISAVPGRLPHTYGREQQGYSCGTLFVDHASGKIFNFCQFSTRASDTLDSKRRLEKLAKDEGFNIKAYHTDNGIFASAAFKSSCDAADQQLTFSGVGAQHQNGVAERNIRTVAQWARASLFHSAFHWPQHASVNLWPFAIDYAIWVFNRLPNVNTGLCPNEHWTQVRAAHDDLRRAHVWGCPVYVLDPKLQDGKKIPKWDPRARLGMFVGFSKAHSSLVPLVLNIRTGKISPQYHVVFDDKFETVHSLPAAERLDAKWSRIFKLDTEFYLDLEYDAAGNIKTSHLPSLDDEWLGKDKQGAPYDRITRPFRMPPRASTPPQVPLVEPTDDPIFDNEVDSDVDEAPGGASVDDVDQTPGGASTQEGTLPNNVLAPGGVRRSRRNAGSYLDGPAINRRLPTEGAEWETMALTAAREWAEVPPLVASRTSSQTTYHPQTRVSKAMIAESTILKDNWDDTDIESLDNRAYLCRDFWHPCLVDVADPRVLSAKTSKYNEDNPSWEDAMNGPFQAEYWEACVTELKTLEEEMKSWTLVRRTETMKVLPSTWAFKCKRRPDGEIKKFKARFCVRGDMQVKGIDCDETWSPVAQWATIRTMMVLAAKLNLCSAQCDITAAFLHAKLPKGKEVYVHQPRGFMRGKDYVLKLFRSQYGMRDSPRYFFDYLTKKLEHQGFRQSDFDPCLFLSSDTIVIVYVDDLLVYSRSQTHIDNFIEGMVHQEVLLRKEGTAEGYLGVDIKRDGNKTTLTQSGLAERVVKALGLHTKFSTPCLTPAECAPLPRDKDGTPATGTVNYASVIGMLLYLSGHSRPDIAFAVHQCARYSFEPKKSHEVALKRIGRYLKGTIDKGLILDPRDDLQIDCYPDADFAGLWGHEHPQDPHCARSRTGYVITLAGCPVLWTSKLQTEIALSTMEAEYVALSQSCKDLFPLIDVVRELSECLNLAVNDGSNLHVRVHEDNVGALTLGKLEPRRMTLRSKHYAIKYHWFREHIRPRKIQLVKIASAEQLGDMFTKGLGRVMFERLRNKLMGW